MTARSPVSVASFVVLLGVGGGCGLTGGSGGDSDGKGISAPPGPSWPGTATALSVSQVNTCAVATGGVGYCWGSNAEFQLTWPHTIAEITNTCSSAQGGSSFFEWPCVGRAPVPVTGDLRWQTLKLSFEEFLCGVTTAGAVNCYSHANASSGVVDYPAGTMSASGAPLCNGILCSNVPLPLKGGGTYTSFAFGFGNNFGCGLTTSGTAMCVGSTSQSGMLGSGTTIGETIYTPRAVAGNLVFTKLAVALTGSHACGLTADGSAYCWGEGARGQLGVSLATVPDAMPDGVPYPIAVNGGLHFKWISAGANQTCAVEMTGAAYCWGQGAYGSFGNGMLDYQVVAPTATATGKVFTAIEVGSGIACGVDSAGDGWCWGGNTYGQLGNASSGTNLATPVKVEGGHTWKTIVPALDHTCGITTDGAVYCWGRNTVGQLGAPSLWAGASAPNSPIPVAVGR